MKRHIGWNIGRVQKRKKLTWNICVLLTHHAKKKHKSGIQEYIFTSRITLAGRINNLSMSEYHYERSKCRGLINGTDHPFLHIRNARSFIRKQETSLPHQVPGKKYCKIFLKARSLHKFQEWDKSPHLRSRLSPRRTRRPKWPPLAFSCWLAQRERSAKPAGIKWERQIIKQI